MEADLNALKNGGASLNPMDEPTSAMTATGMSGGDADELTSMIKKIEAKLTRSITQIDGLGQRVEDLENELAKLKKNGRKSSTAVTGNGSLCTQDEIDKWNAWVNKHNSLEERFNKLMTEWENHDAPKVKTDIIQLFC